LNCFFKRELALKSLTFN